MGHSDDPDSTFAVEDVLEQCLTPLSGQSPQAGILLTAIDYDHALVLQRIQQTFPGIQLIGGTTDGEISSQLAFQQDSLVLMVFYSDEVEFIAGVGRNVSSDPMAIAQQTALATAAQLSQPPKLCLTIPESLTASGAVLLDGLVQGLGPTVPIVGGTTGDQRGFRSTLQFFNTEVLQDAVPLLLLSGNLIVGCSVANGWTPMGKQGIATKVDGNVLHEIDGRSPMEFCQDLGMDRPTPEYRIAVFEPEDAHWYLRTANGSYAPNTGSITFFADVPLHAKIQLVRASRSDMLEAVETSAKEALANYAGSQPEAALFFSCSNRRYVLGTKTQEEYRLATEVLGQDLPMGGFYTYGEIAPLAQNARSRFHNETFVTLLLGTR